MSSRLSWPHLLLTLLAFGATGAEPTGAQQAVTPASLPPAPAHVAPFYGPETERSTVREHLLSGDLTKALGSAEALARHGRTRADQAAAWVAVGWIHRTSGRHNLASEAFTQARIRQGPLASIATYFEAEQDLLRGKPAVAATECERYRERYPEGTYAEDCLRIIALGRARTGRSSEARETAEAWDTEHKTAPIGEQIELELALHWEPTQPEAAGRIFRRLARTHSMAHTGRKAEAGLERLVQAGILESALPEQSEYLKNRVGALITAGRLDNAWELFEHLGERGEDDPRLMKWYIASYEDIAWATRHWSVLGDVLDEEQPHVSDANRTWKRYRSLWRAGEWEEAAAQATEGLQSFGTEAPWKKREETLGHMYLLAGEPSNAQPLFDSQIRRGGWNGRRARFYAGLSRWMQKDYASAIDHFDVLVKQDAGYVEEALYWRAKTREQLGDTLGAAQDRDQLKTNPYQWHALLLAQNDPARPTAKPFARTGEWLEKSAGFADPIANLAPSVSELLKPVSPLASAFQPNWLLAADAPLPQSQHATVLARPHGFLPERSDIPCDLYSPTGARQHLARLARKHNERWPTLNTIHTLASVGLNELAGPLHNALYKDVRKALRSSRHPKHGDAQKLETSISQWRETAYYTGDNQHAAQLTHPVIEHLKSSDHDTTTARRLGYPIAHNHAVWTAAQVNDIDPYLILALMRQESLYNARAISHAGARGPMQIMPKTGNLLAYGLADDRFTGADLEDPAVAIGYGSAYLNMLFERFEGSFPLALASYNAGPHNVSAWYQATGPDMPLDLWVELVPYRETRSYIKKVTGHYASYLSLYEQDGTSPTLHPLPRTQHPHVVQF